MQVRFIMILHAQGYNSLNYPTLYYEVWNINVSKYNPFQIGQPGQLIQVRSFIHALISVFLVFIELLISTIKPYTMQFPQGFC